MKALFISILELEAQLSKREEVIFSEGMYWVKKDGNADPVPFCQKCHDADGKMVRLRKRVGDEYGHDWNCHVCGSGYGTYKPAPPITYMRDRDNFW